MVGVVAEEPTAALVLEVATVVHQNERLGIQYPAGRVTAHQWSVEEGVACVVVWRAPTVSLSTNHNRVCGFTPSKCASVVG